MRWNGKALLVLVAAVLLFTKPVLGSKGNSEMTGTVIGRTGEILQISLPEPVREGAIMEVKPIKVDPNATEIRILSCTHEAPYVALAKVVNSNSDPIATGVHAYGSAQQIVAVDAPPVNPVSHKDSAARFSIQTGAFRPSTSALRSSTADYWQDYRLNYDLLHIGALDAQLSAEYAKGIGDAVSDGITAHRTMEVMPLGILGKFKPIRVGGVHLFLGAGTGWYTIRTTDTIGGVKNTDTLRKFGYEYSLGLEQSRGWTLELRYQGVPSTDIRGYSLALGGRF